MKKPTKTQLMRRADKLFSEHWRQEVGRCEQCGRKEQLQVAHIISRDCRKLRYDRDNILILCFSCHFTFHRKPLAFAEFVKLKKGEDMYKYLIKSSNILHPLGVEFYNKVIKKYSI